MLILKKYNITELNLYQKFLNFAKLKNFQLDVLIHYFLYYY